MRGKDRHQIEMENHGRLGKRIRAEITYATLLGCRYRGPRIAMARTEHRESGRPDCHASNNNNRGNERQIWPRNGEEIFCDDGPSGEFC
jgi:hypothetical protein